MKNPYINISLLLLVLMPVPVFAQALSVLGGDAKAQECYDNAEIAAQNTPVTGRYLLKACDYALDFGTLSLADRAATYANRGIILAANQDIDSAMSDYRKAMNISPSTPEIYVNRGNAFFLDRDYAMALEDYENSVALGIRQLHFVRYNMGMTYEKLDNLEAAQTQLLMALELEPGWELAVQRLARLKEKQQEALEESVSSED